MTRRFSISLLFVALAIWPAFAQTPAATPAAAQADAPTAKPRAPGIYAVFTTSAGNFTVRLRDDAAPKTVENFVGLAEGKKQWTDPKTGMKVSRPYYNGLRFHRTMENFMIQSGDPLGTGFGGPGFTFNDEFSPKLKHDKPGIMSMANGGPNTNGGQFFITVAPYKGGDGHHSAFGEVVEGMDVVMAISKMPVGGPNRDRPLKPVIIKSVRIERVPAA